MAIAAPRQQKERNIEASDDINAEYFKDKGRHPDYQRKMIVIRSAVTGVIDIQPLVGSTTCLAVRA